jgi:hypothetical protein
MQDEKGQPQTGDPFLKCLCPGIVEKLASEDESSPRQGDLGASIFSILLTNAGSMDFRMWETSAGAAIVAIARTVEIALALRRTAAPPRL